MSSTDGIQKILDELIHNASELQEIIDPVSFAYLLNLQSRLLDSLFLEWDQFSEEEKTKAIESKLETRIQQFAKQNQAYLKKVHEMHQKVSKKAPEL